MVLLVQDLILQCGVPYTTKFIYSPPFQTETETHSLLSFLMSHYDMMDEDKLTLELGNLIFGPPPSQTFMHHQGLLCCLVLRSHNKLGILARISFLLHKTLHSSVSDFSSKDHNESHRTALSAKPTKTLYICWCKYLSIANARQPSQL